MMQIHNAKITGTQISNADYGCLTIFIHVEYDLGCQGFGGYCLYKPLSDYNDTIKGTTGHFIYRVLQVAGVNEWDDLIGKTIRIKSDDSKIYEIGHIIKDDWFNPSKDFNNERGK